MRLFPTDILEFRIHVRLVEQSIYGTQRKIDGKGADSAQGTVAERVAHVRPVRIRKGPAHHMVGDLQLEPRSCGIQPRTRGNNMVRNARTALGCHSYSKVPFKEIVTRR